MFLKKSRYKNSVPFNLDDTFSGVRPRNIEMANGVVEHKISAGDRLDLLARNYYNDDRLWWRILDANPDIIFASDLSVMTQVGNTILIPRARE